MVLGWLRQLWCKLGVHRYKWGEEGLTCVDCGHFVPKSEVLAEWFGGW